MSISIVASIAPVFTNDNSTPGTVSISSDIPAQTQPGDLIVMVVMTRAELNNPEGFTTAAEESLPANSLAVTRVATKIAASGDAGKTINLTNSGDRLGLGFIVFRSASGSLRLENIATSQTDSVTARLAVGDESIGFSAAGTLRAEFSPTAETLNVSSPWDLKSNPSIVDNRLGFATVSPSANQVPAVTWTSGSQGLQEYATISCAVVQIVPVPETEEEIWAANFAEVQGAPPQTTALIRAADAQTLADHNVGLFLNGPRWYRLPVVVPVGQLVDFTIFTVRTFRADLPGLRTGKKLMILGREGTASPGVVTLTCWG